MVSSCEEIDMKFLREVFSVFDCSKLHDDLISSKVSFVADIHVILKGKDDVANLIDLFLHLMQFFSESSLEVKVLLCL